MSEYDVNPGNVLWQTPTTYTPTQSPGNAIDYTIGSITPSFYPAVPSHPPSCRPACSRDSHYFECRHAELCDCQRTRRLTELQVNEGL